MKKLAVNILCTTGITLVILATIATFCGGSYLFISSVFESFLANIIIHVGLVFAHKFESRYALLEFTLDIGYTVAVVIICGAIFHWYSSTPIWTLTIMAVLIYLIAVLLSTVQMRREVEEINQLLQKGNAKMTAKERKK